MTWKNYLGENLEREHRRRSDYVKQVAYLVINNVSGNPLSLPSDDDTKLWPPRITGTGTGVYLIPVRALSPVERPQAQH